MSFDINSELFALKTFERYNDEMKYIIDSTSSLYLKIVNLKTFDELSKMLKLLDLDTNSICAKEITNLGGWCCADCVRSDNSIYCQECWSQMKDVVIIIILIINIFAQNIREYSNLICLLKNI